MKVDGLRAKLAIGATQANRGEFVEQSIPEIIEEARREHNAWSLEAYSGSQERCKRNLAIYSREME